MLAHGPLLGIGAGLEGEVQHGIQPEINALVLHGLPQKNVRVGNAGMKVSGRDQEETHHREEKVPSPPGNAMNGGWAEGRPLGGGRLRVLVE